MVYIWHRNIPALSLTQEEQAFADNLIAKTPEDSEFVIQEKVIELLEKDPDCSHALNVIRMWVDANKNEQPSIGGKKTLFHSIVCAYIIRDCGHKYLATRFVSSSTGTLVSAIQNGSTWEREMALDEFNHRARKWLSPAKYHWYTGALKEYDPERIPELLRKVTHNIDVAKEKYQAQLMKDWKI